MCIQGITMVILINNILNLLHPLYQKKIQLILVVSWSLIHPEELFQFKHYLNTAVEHAMSQ